MFKTKLGEGIKDVIVCTAKSNSDVNVENGTTKITDIINKCIVIYYGSMLQYKEEQLNFDNNDESKTVEKKQQKDTVDGKILIIYNQNKLQQSISFPFVIRVADSNEFNIVWCTLKISCLIYSCFVLYVARI